MTKGLQLYTILLVTVTIQTYFIIGNEVIIDFT